MASLFDKYINNGGRIHFIGVGGVMMNCLARALHARGATVTGSDRAESDNVRLLRSLGIDVRIGHLPDYVRSAALVVRNAAIHDDSPDVVEARRLGIPVMERPEALGELMRGRRSVCIAGTNGKSTTSSMATEIALAAGLDPTVFLGAELPTIGGAYREGGDGLFIAEACEYCDSFLSLFPTCAVITNIEEDHLDYFSGIDAIKTSFRTFAERTPADGLVVVNADDRNVTDAMAGIERRLLTFGIHGGDIRAEQISYDRGFARFTLTGHGAALGSIALGVPGRFNVYNALAAAAALLENGADYPAVREGLSRFTGALRRFQQKGYVNGAVVADDYAHHPTALAQTLDAAREMGYRRILCVFQPHTYSRTRMLLDDFAAALQKADLAVIADIYAAREQNVYGVTSEDLALRIPGAVHLCSFEQIETWVRENAREGDLVLTAGAGDIYAVADKLVHH